MSEQIEGRNAVLEAFRSGKCVDKLFILDGCQDGPVRTIAREARKTDTIINYVSKERLDQLSETHAHQGVIAQVAAYDYSTVDEILARAEERTIFPVSSTYARFAIASAFFAFCSTRSTVVPSALISLIISKIRIILEQLSVPQILQERME